MGSKTHNACALLLALAAFIHGSAAKLNMNHICALVNDGLLISAPDACDTYYMCQGGVAAVQNCSPGQYFNKESQTCVSQDQVQCAAATSVPCSGYALRSWAPVAGSCTDFYYCSENGPERSTCPNGEYFNPLQQACVYPDQYYCVPEPSDSTGSADSENSSEDDTGLSVMVTINLCNFIQNGIFFGSPSACSGWNKCVDNVLVSGVCPNNLEYDVLTMQCQYPQAVTCSQVTNDPYLTSSKCSTQGTKKSGPACDTYLVCDGSNYQVAHCSSGEFYDTVSQTCVDRLDARNDCDRCEGSTKTFVNMYSASNCTGYLYCLNGIQASSGYCPSGSYFNEKSGACIEGISDPLLGCCNPKYYSNDSTNESSTDKSTTDETSTDESTTDKSTTDKTATDESVTDESVTDESTTDEPTTTATP